MIRKIILTAAACILVILNSCKSNPVTPPEIQPGRRDYEWTVDTINTFNPIYRIWGSSPTDIWAITSGTYYKNIYHFDENNWNTGTYKLKDYYGLYSIYDFSSNEVYIGVQNRIYRFNVSNWERLVGLTKDGHILHS